MFLFPKRAKNRCFANPGSNQLPLHIEGSLQCQFEVISKCIEHYPGSVEIRNSFGNFPLTTALNKSIFDYRSDGGSNVFKAESTFVVNEES
jgi:hypothetical protein